MGIPYSNRYVIISITYFLKKTFSQENITSLLNYPIITLNVTGNLTKINLCWKFKKKTPKN